MLAVTPGALGGTPVLHTDPLNLDPTVRDGLLHFYNLDYDGALQRFEEVDKAHPDSPMAKDYILTVVIFRELYHQDLLDTTYYAHDSFLSSKRSVDVPAATRQRIEDLTDTVVSLCDKRIKANGNDKDAYFERGYARGLHSAFITLVDHSFASAARQGYAARNDSEQALKIDPRVCGREDGGGHPAVCGGEPAAAGAADGGHRRRGREQGEGARRCCGIRRRMAW